MGQCFLSGNHMRQTRIQEQQKRLSLLFLSLKKMSYASTDLEARMNALTNLPSRSACSAFESTASEHSRCFPPDQQWSSGGHLDLDSRKASQGEHLPILLLFQCACNAACPRFHVALQHCWKVALKDHIGNGKASARSKHTVGFADHLGFVR